MPAAAVRRRRQALSGFTGRKECAGVLARKGSTFIAKAISVVKSDVKFRSSTPELHPILLGLRGREADGTHGVGVKSVDIVRNTRGEGGQLAPT